MLHLSNLVGPAGGRKSRKRVGRGIGSGTGKTSGKGQKGQKCRSGGSPHPWFEGGQMPLQRRLPKRGFTNIFRKEYEIVNVSQLARCAGADPVTPEMMKEKGLIKKIGAVKILGCGELAESLTVHAHKFSGSAQAKIEKSGGKVVNL
ncbi:MAG: 50S ribosomal protein L15 [Nitrospina sp.]|jgi:large subunit ribosomal protein L15|nr:50S ribosomal protein L15 [Nitrospina sp.]MBT3510960.1 50S ribosomal protein L15 [Nitrospina sp.]MBT3875037.1 50S ribosomal protein L15 [Nitrospina sp.]MBT4047384.1 50S ribosomal protein L15 [Nitrospina sp.]MBT4558468.1 50S ribosomal protein L15 [Nitrospina sp.]